MNLLQKSLLGVEAAYARAWRGLDRAPVLAHALWLVPLAFGLLSLCLGQDDNWDLHNYHFYNPYALLNGKIGFDLAPGQWQSYFNPTLDLLYYGLITHMPAPLAGFIMGVLHGLNFVLVLALARLLLPAGSGADTDTGAHRAALLLALAGTLAPGFLSELGNTMGDNLTSLCVLGALLLLLRQWPQLSEGKARGAAMALLAGLLMGVGAGLKLTNATYALAQCLALFALGGGFWPRLRMAFIYGVGVLAGIGVSAGHWYWKMWTVFGNPLFPQFNDRFKGPLAAPIGIGDTGWIPKGISEKLLWPFIFTLNPKRVIEIPMTQILWPMLYLAFAALAVLGLRALLLARPPLPDRALAPRARFVLLFFALSYLGWLNLFGIYRYLVPLELLAPLALWLVLHRLMPAPVARGVAAYGLLLAVLAIFPVHNWGHGAWARSAFSADVPAFPQPEDSMVFTVHGDPPMGWLVPLFPNRLAFVALGSGFPESQGYRDRVESMMASRRGPLYVMLQADRHDPAQQRAPEEQRQAQENKQLALGRAQEILQRYALALDPASCRPHAAFVGRSRWTFQLCTVRRP